VIDVQNLKKVFGPKVAVDGISFAVQKGEVLGFLGPNGAGKSTTMRMITGFIPPSAGTISIGGFDVTENPIAAKRLFGYLPENAPSYTDMTVGGFLNFAAELRGLKSKAKEMAVGHAVEMCFLGSVFEQSIETLSKGYKHRVCFAQAIIHDPKVLIMDEPTEGLDPNQKHEMRTLIRRMGETKAIIFSTHILEEVEAACSRAIIIDRGKIVANGTPRELKERSQTAGTVTLSLGNAFGAFDGVAASVQGKIDNLSHVKKTVIIAESPFTIRVFPMADGPTDDLAAVLGELALDQRWPIRELRREEGRLDEVFRSITLSDREP
ncbi:MAG TPA: ATP-binding cassette domain-containing protein, partial [Candidatus Udaeobacter sp.]|jgi:ABC-2 type transport system ATP-binding protein|nr:ATP-binding cassette domain-containing protein [Candidatus Udaeobacter sp.]